MNFAWVKRWFDGFHAGTDQVLEFYADDIQFEDVTFGFKANGKVEARKFFAAFSDPAVGEHIFTVHNYQGDEKSGAAEWTWQAKHVADFLGLPARGKETTVRGVSVVTFKNGKIATQHDYWNAAAMFRQLGVLK